jgi:hypothetical protein
MRNFYAVYNTLERYSNKDRCLSIFESNNRTNLDEFMKQIFSICIFLIFGACTTDSGVYKKSSNYINYLVKNAPSPWSEISSEGSDYALFNHSSKSIFLFNSACRKNEGSSLQALTSSILSGIEEVEISESKNVRYQEREAIEVSASGKIDGIVRYFKIVTIQKNNCIYDYVLISTNLNNLTTDSIALKNFLDRIRLN